MTTKLFKYISPDMNEIQIKVPEFGESITEATLASWLRTEGDSVEIDEPIAELETDKVSVELVATEAGLLSKMHSKEGDVVRVGDVVATITVGATQVSVQPKHNREENQIAQQSGESAPATTTLSPAVAKMVSENNIDIANIQGTGKHNQITKEDVQNYLNTNVQSTPAKRVEKSVPFSSAPSPKVLFNVLEEQEEVVSMSRLRQVIAKRLVGVQQSAAILTTFNEVNMKAIMDIRKQYKDKFLNKHGIKPGFMSFFTKAVIQALQEFPAMNAEIRDTDIVYKKHFHIGIAVGGPKGLVVPVVKHANQYSLAEIEIEIAKLATQIKNSTLPFSALEGGTFTISNGGVYGSMLSTPILNPPQTGILGMHNIVERPVVVNGEIVIRPIMYLALSYDHRMVDGKEAVQFLVKIKETIEDPVRLVLNV